MATKTAVSAGGIILREKDGMLKIALAHHKPNTASTHEWILPKGHVEAGETLEQAALREIHEETGLNGVVLIKHLGTLMRESMKSGEVVEKTIHYYLAYALVSGQQQEPTDDRFTEVGWFGLNQALTLIPYEAERVFLREQLGLLFG